jgi:uncharacterized membrane protein
MPSTKLLFRDICIAMILIASVLCAPSAKADFKVCNKTQHDAIIAIGLLKGKGWVSEGWWRIKPTQCKQIVQGPLKARYYYLRAIHVGVEGNWDGNRSFCVAARNFSIKGRKDCIKRGYGQAGFFEVDTGNKLTWVQNISD